MTWSICNQWCMWSFYDHRDNGGHIYTPNHQLKNMR